MSSESSIVFLGWCFVSAIVASLTFLLSIFFFVQMFVFLFSTDPTYSASNAFWSAFLISDLVKLIVGLALASLAGAQFTERLFGILKNRPEKQWQRYASSYFVALFIIVVLSTASFYLAQFPNVPPTHTVAFLCMVVCIAFSSTVYGVVASAGKALLNVTSKNKGHLTI